MIRAYTGMTGSGKTLSMVRDAVIHYREHQRPIYANFSMKVFDFDRSGFWKAIWPKKIKDAFINATVLRSEDFLDKLLTTRDGLFLVDEAGFVFNNRKWKDLPFELMTRFQQSRHFGVDIFYTTQNIMRVDSSLRELTHIQVMCNMINIPTTDIHIMLTNKAYLHDIIGRDSKANRELYYAWEEYIPFWKFKQYYPLYDTMEVIDYSIVGNKKKSK